MSMKRKLSIIILIIILCNYIMPRFCYADLSDTVTEMFEAESAGDVMNAYTKEAYDNLNNDGSAEIRGQSAKYTEVAQTKSFKQMIVVYIFTILDMLPIATQALITTLTSEGFTAESGATSFFTIESLVKNKRQIFDINFFDFNTESKSNVTFKKSVATWYYVLRQLAIVMSLCVLIYIGIRMAISTTATDKAMYKKMFIGWVEGVIIIWIMPYILTLATTVANTLLEWINRINTDGFEGKIINNFYDSIKNSINYEIIYWSIIYWGLMYYQLRFVLAYAKRFMSTAFLIMISPLVSVTYAIDKVGDGKAQGFRNLLKELMVNIFIQPLHALIFVIFIETANNIANIAPILALLFFAALMRAEKIIKTIFDMRGLVSIHSLGEILPIKKKH